MTKIFIDGEAGTTGLQILDRLKNRREFALLHLTDNKRKDKYAYKYKYKYSIIYNI